MTCRLGHCLCGRPPVEELHNMGESKERRRPMGAGVLRAEHRTNMMISASQGRLSMRGAAQNDRLLFRNSRLSASAASTPQRRRDTHRMKDEEALRYPAEYTTTVQLTSHPRRLRRIVGLGQRTLGRHGFYGRGRPGKPES